MKTVEVACQVAAAISMGITVIAFKAARFGAVEAGRAINRSVRRTDGHA